MSYCIPMLHSFCIIHSYYSFVFKIDDLVGLTTFRIRLESLHLGKHQLSTFCPDLWFCFILLQMKPEGNCVQVHKRLLSLGSQCYLAMPFHLLISLTFSLYSLTSSHFLFTGTFDTQQSRLVT